MKYYLLTMLVSFVIFVIQDLAGARPNGNMLTLAWWFNSTLVGIASVSIVKTFWSQL